MSQEEGPIQRVHTRRIITSVFTQRRLLFESTAKWASLLDQSERGKNILDGLYSYSSCVFFAITA